MNNRLYVGNLAYSTTSDALRACFLEFGEVTDSHVVMDRETGRARGFAFITMSTEVDAGRALSALNGTLLDGRAMRVNVAEERAARPAQREARGGHRGW